MAKTALSITDEELTRYRAALQQRKAQERRELQQRLKQARHVAGLAADRLKAMFGAQQVILYGSVARGQSFQLRSDIDLAVAGIRESDFWRAWSSLDSLAGEFEIDLVPLETASPRLRQILEQEGIEL
jgi:predicted nucleotidyltransferase